MQTNGETTLKTATEVLEEIWNFIFASVHSCVTRHRLVDIKTDTQVFTLRPVDSSHPINTQRRSHQTGKIKERSDGRGRLLAWMERDAGDKTLDRPRVWGSHVPTLKILYADTKDDAVDSENMV